MEGVRTYRPRAVSFALSAGRIAKAARRTRAWLRDFVRPPRFQYRNETLDDRWVVECVFPGRRGGYFVEAGAANGIDASCTYVLEHELGWTGLCIEPNAAFFAKLVVNRPHSACENVCLAGRAGVVMYAEGKGDTADAYLGGITDNLRRFKSGSAAIIERAPAVQKPAAPLAALLDRHAAPPVIDYAAFDIEGSELEVVTTFPFDRYTFLAVSLECDGIIWGDITRAMTQRGYREVTNPFNLDRPWERYWLHHTL